MTDDELEEAMRDCEMTEEEEREFEDTVEMLNNLPDMDEWTLEIP